MSTQSGLHNLDIISATPAFEEPVNSHILISTFPLFPKLPTELRIKVWNFAVDDADPRVSRVNITINDPPNHTRRGLGSHKVEISSTVPAVLHACFESRRELLPRFTKFDTLCSYIEDGYMESNSNKAFYINPQADQLFITFIKDFSTLTVSIRKFDSSLCTWKLFSEIKILLIEYFLRMGLIILLSDLQGGAIIGEDLPSKDVNISGSQLEVRAQLKVFPHTGPRWDPKLGMFAVKWFWLWE